MDGYEDLPSKGQGADPYGDLPGRGSSVVSQIPTSGMPTVEPTTPAGEPKFLEKATMYASAVPAAGLLSQALKAGTAATRLAPYTSRLAEALTPTTLRGLTTATGAAGATAIPAEATRAALEKRGFGPGAQALGEAAAAGGVGALGGLGAAGARLARTALGGEAKREAAALQQRVAQQYQPAITAAEQERGRAERVIQQMERQPTVAGQRAAQAPLTAEQQLGALQAEVRQPVREKAGIEARRAEETAAQAAARAQAAEASTAQAQAAVNQLEQQLLAKPTMTAEEFGAALRKTTDQLQQNLMRARSEGANLGQVIRSAGTDPTINTAPLIAQAKSLAERTRNPQVLAMLSEIEGLAMTGKQAALSLEQADSLRKYLNKDILAKFFAQTGADKETLKALRSLRGALIEQTPKQYREALGKFSELSRPLDIVERQGALKRVVDIDPMSTAEKLTEAQVVGEIINKARAGNPVFTRLLETNPQLKEAGRLYFTQDLFGKGAVPTEAVLRNWLRTNERPLRQLGLYDEFKDMRLAKEAAQRAVNEAKLAEKEAVGVAREAGAAAKEAVSLSKKAEARLQEALGTAAGPTQKPGETLAEALRRTRTGEKAAPIQTFIQTREKQAEAVRSLTKMQGDIQTAKTPKEIKAAVETAAGDLLKRGIIDDAGYRTMLRDVQRLQSMTDARDKARKIVGYFAGLVGVGYLGRRTAESIVEGR